MNLFALSSSVCALAASFLAYHDKAVWGWFLLAAVLIAGAASEWKPYSKA